MPPFDPTAFFDVSIDDPVFRLALIVLEALIVLAFAFTAVAVALRVANERRRARRERLDALWRPLLLEVLAGDRPVADLHATVPRRSRFYFCAFLYRFARKVRGPEREPLREAARPFLPELRDGLRKAAPEARARRLQILGLLGFPDYAEDLVSALDDPSPLVAMVALRNLARREHPAFTPLLLEKLPRFEDFSHDSLASLLAGIGFEAAAPLRRVLGDAERPVWVRAVAAKALGRIGDVAAADLAADVLDACEDPELILAALELIGRVGDARHRAAVEARLRSPHEEVRLHAVRALGALGGAGVRAALRRALDDPSPWVALAAAESLKKIGAAGLLRALAASTHPRTALFQQVLTDNSLAA